jgi:hypothetical protein
MVKVILSLDHGELIILVVHTTLAEIKVNFAVCMDTDY